MAGFLVEAYTPATWTVAEIERRARAAAADSSARGAPVRYLRSIHVPEDEICFHLFEAPSMEVVRQVSDRAGLEQQRIVEVIDGGPEAAVAGSMTQSNSVASW